MLPGVSPGAVRQGVANIVVGDGNTIVGHQQVAPATVTVSIAHGVVGFAQVARGVGVFGTAQDVARVVISPDMGEVSGLVILPDKLVRRVVDIGGSMRTVTDTQDITVIVVGVGFRYPIVGDGGRRLATDAQDIDPSPVLLLPDFFI